MKGLIIFFKGIKDGLECFGQYIGAFVNLVLLSIVYVFGVGATAIVARFVNKRFLELKPTSGRDTYWSDVEEGSNSKDDYLRQF